MSLESIKKYWLENYSVTMNTAMAQQINDYAQKEIARLKDQLKDTNKNWTGTIKYYEGKIEAANKILADVELASCCEGCRVLEALTKVADALLIPRKEEANQK